MYIINKFYKILIFITLIKIAYSFNIHVNQTEINGRKVIRKCCPMGQHVSRTRCQDYNLSKDFSNLNIYDNNINDIHKSFNSVFTILPGIFAENLTFKLNVVNINTLRFIPYIIEDGSLQLELPNNYERWYPVQSGNYCIDYIIRKSGRLTDNPIFWVNIESEMPYEGVDYFTNVSLISCVFLLLVLLVYILLPELQNLCGLILMAYVASLCLRFLLLAIMVYFQHNSDVCIGLTLGIYYFYLASFCWMTIMSYDIWWTFGGHVKDRFSSRRDELSKFFVYCLCAFGVPLLLTIGVGVVNSVRMNNWPWFITPHVPDHGCFLEGWGRLLYLYIPLLILNICNWMLYLMTAFNLWRLNRATAILDTFAGDTPAAHRTYRYRFMVYVKIATVMGLNWWLEVITFKYPRIKVWYLTNICNALIGFYIFLIFVFKKKIYRKLHKRYISARNTRWYYPGCCSSGSTSYSIRETTTLQVCSDPKGVIREI